MKEVNWLLLAIFLFGCQSTDSSGDVSTDTPSDSATETDDSDSSDATDSSTDTSNTDGAMPCAPEDAAPGQTACITWATQSGPCGDEQTACRVNQECISYIGCYDAAFSGEDYQSARADCTQNYPNGSDDYWNYKRCVYCQACKNECAAVSGPVCF